MGCKGSTVENNQRELHNEDIDIKHRFLAGVHISKGSEGIEGNVQIALGTIRKKKYERVNGVPSNIQTPFEENVNNEEASLQAISEAS